MTQTSSAKLPVKPIHPPLPQDNVDFDLTINSDKTNPEDILRQAGHNPKNFEFRGPEVKGNQTRKFRLLDLGECNDVNEAKQRAHQHEHGGFTLAEAQWSKSFTDKFSGPTRWVDIIIGGSDWVRLDDTGRSVIGLSRYAGNWEAPCLVPDTLFRTSCRWLAYHK